MDYYNGVIFQGFLPKIPFPVLSGGRYDNLPRKMGKEVGAIGFALYMGRLEQFFGQERQYDADVLLTYGPDADLVGSARRRCWHDQRGAAQGAAGGDGL